MTNPFREILDPETRETHRMKLPYFGKAFKNIIVCYEENVTDLEYKYLFEQYKEVHPDLCEEKTDYDAEFEKAMKFLDNLRKKDET